MFRRQCPGMKLWLSKTSDVSLQEQLCTQIILGIVSGDLPARERLPSTEEIARRFHIHANTVRSAYRDLVRRGWAKWKRGSGFYVRDSVSGKALDPAARLDHLITAFFEVARNNGYSSGEIQKRIAHWFALQPPDHILVVEPDDDLREILIAEVSAAGHVRVGGATLKDCSQSGLLAGALCVALANRERDIQEALPAETPRLFLHTRSIPKRVAGESRPAANIVVTVVSRWPEFLKWARTTLVAMGIDAAALDLRDARRKGWERGITSAPFIIADVVAARALPAGCRAPRVFQIIADESIAEIRARIAGQ